jgi:Na+/alanine symporter
VVNDPGSGCGLNPFAPAFVAAYVCFVVAVGCAIVSRRLRVGAMIFAAAFGVTAAILGAAAWALTP